MNPKVNSQGRGHWDVQLRGDDSSSPMITLPNENVALGEIENLVSSTLIFSNKGFNVFNAPKISFQEEQPVISVKKKTWGRGDFRKNRLNDCFFV